MAYIYHRCPENMKGSLIYPMSELLEIYPDIFAARQKHHQFQPHVLEGSIPRLGCFWNDTLHFTALHPQKISDALKKFGYSGIKLRYYEVPAEKLEPEKTIVYLNKPREPGSSVKVTDFADYNPVEISKYDFISEESINKYNKNFPTSDEFLLNYGAPYILYKGKLDVSGLKIIEIN